MKKSWLVPPVAIAAVVGCSSGSASAQQALEFPDSVAGLQTMQQQMERFDRDDGSGPQREDAVAGLSAAYDGADAAAQGFADESLMVLVTVYAVDAPSPRLWSTQAGDAIAERLRLPSPPERIETSGDAECLVTVNSLVPAGVEPGESTESGRSTGPTRPDSTVLRCQGVRDGVTVLIPELAPSMDTDTALSIVSDSLDHFRPR